MYNRKKLIEDIIADWSYKVPTGIPDVNNYSHREILREVLKKYKLTTEEISMIIQNLGGDKKLLTEVDSSQSITATTFFGRDKIHHSGSSHQPYIDPYQAQPAVPVQDSDEDEEEVEDEMDSDQKTEGIETYIFNPDAMQIEKTGNVIPLCEVFVDQKFKCFMTNEVYLETENKTLVKEEDYATIKKMQNLTAEEKSQLIEADKGE